MLEKSGISRADLIERAEISQGALSHYMTGKRMPATEEFARIARALGMSMDELYFGPEDAVLREQSAPYNDEAAVWKKRALAAESKLAVVRKGMKHLLDASSDTPLPAEPEYEQRGSATVKLSAEQRAAEKRLAAAALQPDAPQKPTKK